MKRLLFAALLVALPVSATLKGVAPTQLGADQTNVLAAATVTSSNSVIVPGILGRQVDLIVNVKAAPTGTTPTLTFTIQPVDPGDGTTVIGTPSSGLSINGVTTQIISLPSVESKIVKVTWTVTGTSPSFTLVNATLMAKAMAGAPGGAPQFQGLGTVGAPAGGFLTTTPPLTGQIPTQIAGSLTPADTPGTLVVLNTGCSTGVSCAAGSTALVQTAGQQGANVTFTTGSSPVFTVVADCATDGGTAWSLSGSPSTSGLVDFIAPGGVRSNTVVNPGNVSYQLVPQAGCIGTTYRVRIATASPTGSVNAQDRATAVAQPPYAGAIGASSYPSQAVAMMWRDPTTPTTSTAALGNATGEFVQGAGANGATASGNPLRVGAIARATGAAPAQVTAGQTSDLQTDLEHRLWVAAEHPNGSSCIVDAASASTQCVGLSGASLSYYIKSVTFSASAAITFKINSSTTAGNACATAPALVIPTMFFGANTGAPITFPQPIKVTANSALCCLPSGASGSCIISGYIAP